MVKNMKRYQKKSRKAVSGKMRGKVWKDYIKWIMNKDNYWDHNVEEDATVKDAGEFVRRDEVVQVPNETNTRKIIGPSDVPL